MTTETDTWLTHTSQLILGHLIPRTTHIQGNLYLGSKKYKIQKKNFILRKEKSNSQGKSSGVVDEVKINNLSSSFTPDSNLQYLTRISKPYLSDGIGGALLIVVSTDEYFVINLMLLAAWPVHHPAEKNIQLQSQFMLSPMMMRLCLFIELRMHRDFISVTSEL